MATARIQKHKKSYGANNLNGVWEPKTKWTLGLENFRKLIIKTIIHKHREKKIYF
jgi:hypothetical protein